MCAKIDQDGLEMICYCHQNHMLWRTNHWYMWK